MVAINFLQVAMQVRLNLWYRDLFNALGEKNGDAFWFQMLWVFVPLATIWISFAVYELYVDESLKIRWRRWLTERRLRALARWRHALPAQLRGRGDRQPRSAHSDRRQRSSSSATMDLSIRLLSQAATLVSFLVILWALSRDFVFPALGIEVPGLLVWACSPTRSSAPG